jgi:hypothetical protein
LEPNLVILTDNSLPLDQIDSLAVFQNSATAHVHAYV